MDHLTIGILPDNHSIFLSSENWASTQDAIRFIKAINRLIRTRFLIWELTKNIRKLGVIDDSLIPSVADCIYATLMSILDNPEGIKTMNLYDNIIYKIKN